MVPKRADWRALARDRRGSITILFALSIFVVIGTVGLAIDTARAYSVASRISAALDAAALAAGKMLDDEDATDEEIAAKAALFFRIHMENIPVTGVTLSTPVTTVDRTDGVVQVAANVSVATTFAQVARFPAFNFDRQAAIRYSMRHIDLGVALDITGSMCMPCSKIDALKDAARDLVDIMITPQTPYGSVRIALAPYSSALNAGGYAAAVSGGASTDGCVVERSGPNNDANVPPSGGDALGTSSRGLNLRYDCPNAAIVPLTADRVVLRDSITALRTGGWTAGHIGVGWSWYLISRPWAHLFPPDNKPRPPSRKVTKAVLLMTDGEFNTSYLPGAGRNSADPDLADSSGHQSHRLCEAMKSDGVIVFTVAFDAPREAEDLLRRCATSASHAYSAASPDALREAFRQIATRLSALRLTQ